ncbi:MAG: hypothetical protein GY801_40975 [bacterium]|nr:hypothetical protein [bacterium]
MFMQQLQWKPIHAGHIPLYVSSAKLDLGEQEAIALAISHSALLLMDEERGREIARQHGLTVKGTLGILIEAYRKDLIRGEQLRFYFAEISA